MSKHYPVEQHERAVKMVLDHLDEYRSVYAACQAIGPKVVVGAKSLHTSIAFAETLVLEGIAASVVGTPFPTGPLRTIDDVEYATMEWVDWYNNRRLHSQLDYVPPEEYEAAYYAQTEASQPATSQL